MRDSDLPTKASVWMGLRGDVAVFVSGPKAATTPAFDVERLVARLAERGLRLVGISVSPRRRPASLAGMPSTSLAPGSLVETVLSLIDAQVAARRELLVH
jgi:hypothetical protein